MKLEHKKYLIIGAGIACAIVQFFLSYSYFMRDDIVGGIIFLVVGIFFPFAAYGIYKNSIENKP